MKLILMRHLHFQLAFDTPTWSVIKAYVMMIGEFEWEGMFSEHDDPAMNATENAELARNIPFPNYSSVLFVFFAFIMSIIISNLLVGLAVDDIQEIQVRTNHLMTILRIFDLFNHVTLECREVI